MGDIIVIAFVASGFILLCLQIVRFSLRQHSADDTQHIAIIVQNQEADIEATLRMLTLHSAFDMHNYPGKVTVLDVNSSDSTGFIARRLARRNPFIDYHCVLTDEELSEILHTLRRSVTEGTQVIDMRRPNHSA